MNNTRYKQLSENTEKKFPEGLSLPVDIFKDLQEALHTFNDIANTVDGIKKHIIYKPIDTAGKTCLLLTQAQIEILHAVLGMLTEVSEVLDLLLIKNILDIDKQHLSEELGDLLWYVQIILRNTDLEMSDINEINIKKLAARFPNKFCSERALKRDLENEKQAMGSI